jgi:hypothetical protein
LGWTPTIDWDSGLAETVRWYADHRSWWEPLRDRAPVVESAWQSPADAGGADPNGAAGGDDPNGAGGADRAGKAASN